MGEHNQPAACPECGIALREGDRFCSSCGARIVDPLTAAGARVSLDRLFDHLRQGEQRPATILMSDISGFSSLGERVDPEQLFHLINRVFHEFVEILVSHGAHIDKYVGDEIVALFGVPRAQERSAERAVFSALALRERLAEMNAAGEFGDLRLGVHMGINIGPVMVGPVGHRSYADYTVIGDAVNVAKRLETEAPEGEIYVSQAVREAAGTAFEFGQIGSVKVKGREAEVEVFRVVAARPAQGPGATDSGRDYPLMARDREIGELQRHGQLALAGAGQIVGVVGPAGIGKSKLVRSWRAAEGDRDFRVLATSCYSCGDQFPLLPLLDLVSQIDGLALEGWPPRVGLDETVGAAETRALLQLMQGPPEDADPDWHDQVVSGVTAALSRLAAVHPLCVIVDNAHWMDESSRNVLAELAGRLPEVPLLLLLSGRDAEGSWVSNLDPANLIALAPLPRSAMEELSALWALPAILTPETVKAICDRAEGHPYFARELSRGLRRASGAAQSGALPGSLHELFLAQLDGLPREVRRLVQAASVVGEPFSLSVLQAALGADRAAVEKPLGLAVEQDLLQRSVVDGQYAYRRRLLFEAAYETIPPSQRQALHTQIADHLVEALATVGESAVHAAAHHAYLGERDARALELLLRSAQRYRAQYSNRQAVRAATCALEVISSLANPMDWNRERLQALLVVAQASTIIGDLGTAEGTLAEAEIVAEDCDDRELAARVALQAATCSLMLGEYREAYRRFERAAEAWQALGEATRVGHCRVGMGMCAQQLDERDRAVALFREAAAMPGAEPWVRAAALNNAGVLLLEDGHYAAAEDQIRQGLADNEASGDRRGLAHSQCSLGEALYLRGRLEESRHCLEQARTLAQETEDAACLELVTLNLARTLLALGQEAEAGQLLQEEQGPSGESSDPQIDLLRQVLTWQTGQADEDFTAWCPTEGADSGACWNTHLDGLCLRLERALALADPQQTTALSNRIAEALPQALDRCLIAYAHWLLAGAPGAFRAPEEHTIYAQRAQRLQAG